MRANHTESLKSQTSVDNHTPKIAKSILIGSRTWNGQTSLTCPTAWTGRFNWISSWQISLIASTIEIVKVAETVKLHKLKSLSRLAEVGEMLELA